MIRFGIVGAGGIAKKFVRDLAFVKDAKLTAVSARSKEKAESYQKLFDCEFAFSSYETMAQSDAIDAVYIATPHSFHFEHAMLFIKHHKHVLVEKPITVNVTQAKTLFAYAKEQGVLVMEAMWTHFLPAIRYLVDEMEKGTYGKLLKVDIHFGFPLSPFRTTDDRLLNPNLAGGSLLDLGIYPVSFISLLKPTHITKIVAKAKFTKTGVDHYGHIKLIDDKQTHYMLKHSISRLLGDKALLHFQKAKIILPGFHGCQTLIINKKIMKLPHEGEGFVDEIKAFVNDINHHLLEDPIMSHEKTLKTMALMDNIREKIGLKYPFE